MKSFFLSIAMHGIVYVYFVHAATYTTDISQTREGRNNLLEQVSVRIISKSNVASTPQNLKIQPTSLTSQRTSAESATEAHMVQDLQFTPSSNPESLSLESLQSQGMVLEAPLPRYPSSSRRRGEEGTVLLRLELEQGQVQRVLMEQSSGYDALDQAVLRAVKSWKFTKKEPFQLNPTFSFKLTEPMKRF